MFHYTWQLLLILLATGIIAGAIDAIAGGGGLISLPLLLGTGIPPHIALGTNKLQGSIGTLVATANYYRAGLIKFSTIYKGLLFGAGGAILGAIVSQLIANTVLNKAIPILLLIIFIYSLITPKLGMQERKPLWSEFYFYLLFGFLLGFYDAFFGPGTGTLWIFSLTFFLGYNLQKATAYTKIFNLKSNLIATICFALGHNIDYQIAIIMAIGQIIGGRLGAQYAIKKGVKYIRPVYFIVIAVSVISLLYKNYVDVHK